MLNFYLSQDFHLSIKDPSASESTEGFKIEVYSEILSKYDRVIACICFDKKQTKQVPLSFMDGVSQEVFISDIYGYELSKSIDVYCICCDNIPPYDDISSNTVEVEIPQKKDEDALNSLIGRIATTITSGATSIGGYAFYNYSALTEVNFPKATSIEGNAFQNCAALTEVNFPEVTSIGQYAFQNCAALTEVNFPEVTSIGQYAFQNCAGLQYFDMSEVSGVPSITNTSFSYTTCIFLFIDQAQLNAYASATNWSALSSRFRIKGATT